MPSTMFSGLLYALLATVVWSITFIIARLAVGGISPITLAMLKWLIASIILSFIAIPYMKKEWITIKSLLPRLLGVVFFGVAIYSPLSFFGAQTTSAMNLSLISITSPVFIVVIASCLGRKQPLYTWFGSSLALIGSFYLVSNGELERLLELDFVIGDILMLIAAIGFAVYCLLLERIAHKISQISLISCISFLATLMLLPFSIWEMNQENFIFLMNSTIIGCVVFSGIFSALVAWWLWNIGLEKAGPVYAGVMFYTLPLWGGIFGYFLLDEPITSVHVFSGILIVGGIMWASYGGTKLFIK